MQYNSYGLFTSDSTCEYSIGTSTYNESVVFTYNEIITPKVYYFMPTSGHTYQNITVYGEGFQYGEAPRVFIGEFDKKH